MRHQIARQENEILMYSYPQKRQMELQLRVGDGQGKIF